MSRIKNKENGAPIRQDGNAPTTVNDSPSDVSILPQKALKNQGNEDAMSENVMENQAEDIGSEAGENDEGTDAWVNVLSTKEQNEKRRNNYEDNIQFVRDGVWNETDGTGYAEFLEMLDLEEERKVYEDRQKDNDRIRLFIIEKIVSGGVPEYEYNPASDEYDYHPAGIWGYTPSAPTNDLSDLVKASMTMFVQEYKLKHNGKCFTNLDLTDQNRVTYIKNEYLKYLTAFIEVHNHANVPKIEKRVGTGTVIVPDPERVIKYPRSFPEEALMLLILAADEVRKIDDVLYYYQYDGRYAGVWRKHVSLRHDARYDVILEIGNLFGVKAKGYEIGIYKDLLTKASVMQMNTDTCLIPANNGIVDISNVKTEWIDDTHWHGTGFHFVPYFLDDGTENPEYAETYKYMGFTYKLRTNWNPNAVAKDLEKNGYKWNPDRHFSDVMSDGDDKNGFVVLLWQLANFCLRATRSKNYTALFGDASRTGTGGGGKSATMRLIGKTIGEDLVLYRSIDELCDNKFGRDGIDNVIAVFSDETKSDVGKGILHTEIFKAMIRGENVELEVKFERSINFKIFFTTTFAFNGAIKFNTNEEAVWAKTFVIPFSKNFRKQGIDKSFVVDEFMEDPYVREFVLYKALSLGPITGYTEEYVKPGLEYLEKMKTSRSTVWMFMDHWTNIIAGTRHPVSAVYRYYLLWCNNNGYKTPATIDTFKQQAIGWLNLNASDSKLEEDPVKIQNGTRLLQDAPPEQYLMELANTYDKSVEKWIEKDLVNRSQGEWNHEYTKGGRNCRTKKFREPYFEMVVTNNYASQSDNDEDDEEE